METRRIVTCGCLVFLVVGIACNKSSSPTGPSPTNPVPDVIFTTLNTTLVSPTEGTMLHYNVNSVRSSIRYTLSDTDAMDLGNIQWYSTLSRDGVSFLRDSRTSKTIRGRQNTMEGQTGLGLPTPLSETNYIVNILVVGALTDTGAGVKLPMEIPFDQIKGRVVAIDVTPWSFNWEQ